MDLLNKCRVCTNIINANDKNNNLLLNTELAYKFTACTSLEPDEDLPNMLCQSCCDHVIEFYAFRTKSIAANDHWRALKLNNVIFVEVEHNVDVAALGSGDLQPEKAKHCELGETNPRETKKRRGRPPKRRNFKFNEEPVYDLELQQHSDITLVDPAECQLIENTKQDALQETKQILTKNCKDRSSKATKSSTAQKLNFADEKTEEDKITCTSTLKRRHDGIEPTANYKCNICPRRFFVEHRLIAHKRRHEGLPPYPCTQAGCERGFNRPNCLSEHLKQHAGNIVWYACEQAGCNKSYKHKPTLVMHMRKYHKLGPEIKSHVCEFCGKVFKSSAVLNDHRYTHKDKSEFPHACQQTDCTRRFTSKEKLKVHMMRHAGIKNFICPHCGLKKTTRNELNIHINYHTLERTWPCRFCSKVCNNAGNLKMHVRTIHERAKDFACSYCERTFAKPDTRKYHEMTHTGEKPHKCEECGKCFTQPAALRTHRKIHLRQRGNALPIMSESPNAKVVGTENAEQSV